jgi:protein-S-isoprenylcysteine O-methyltransferase Ste14
MILYMHLDPFHLTTSLWILVGIYWAASGIRVKPVARSQGRSSRAVHIGVMAVAFLLIFEPYTSIGPLAVRFVPAEGWLPWFGFALTAAGCAFAVWARALLGGNWSAAVTLKRGHKLVRSGPYALVRHPIYAGFLAGLLGTAVVIGEVRALLALAIAFLAWFDKTRVEERFMLDQFDGEYVEYSRSVKRLIPFLL